MCILQASTLEMEKWAPDFPWKTGPGYRQAAVLLSRCLHSFTAFPSLPKKEGFFIVKPAVNTWRPTGGGGNGAFPAGKEDRG